MLYRSLRKLRGVGLLLIFLLFVKCEEISHSENVSCEGFINKM